MLWIGTAAGLAFREPGRDSRSLARMPAQLCANRSWASPKTATARSGWPRPITCCASIANKLLRGHAGRGRSARVWDRGRPARRRRREAAPVRHRGSRRANLVFPESRHLGGRSRAADTRYGSGHRSRANDLRRWRRSAVDGPSSYSGRRPEGSRFGYAGLSLSVPERVRFRYRLDGFDSGWSEPSRHARGRLHQSCAAAHIVSV